MTSGEASLLAKLEQIEHNQKKIMRVILHFALEKLDIVYQDICNLWDVLDEELAEKKRLKAQAKRNGYTTAQWKKIKKAESDK